MCFRQSSAGLLADVSPIEYVRRPRIKLNVDTERRLRYNGNMNITKKRKQKLLAAALALTVMLTPGGIFDACEAEITTWGRADLKDLDDANIGLAGSPTKIAKASDKVRKGAGEKVTLDPEESVVYLMGKLAEKHII